jgi:hypothetical protein
MIAQPDVFEPWQKTIFNEADSHQQHSNGFAVADLALDACARELSLRLASGSSYLQFCRVSLPRFLSPAK